MPAREVKAAVEFQSGHLRAMSAVPHGDRRGPEEDVQQHRREKGAPLKCQNKQRQVRNSLTTVPFKGLRQFTWSRPRHSIYPNI